MDLDQCGRARSSAFARTRRDHRSVTSSLVATTFQRARSDEQRAQRRQAILATAQAMLEDTPVAELSLNELSRRVGLAKSNVLRYFDSREAVLLELMVSSVAEWCAHLAEAIPAAVSRRAGFPRRAEQLAAVIAMSLAERPALCDLISAQASVLERNVSAEAVTRYKLESLAEAEQLAEVIHKALVELNDDAIWSYVIGVFLMTSALWAYANPPEAVRQAHKHERLQQTQLEFPVALEDYLITLAIGIHTRAS